MRAFLQQRSLRERFLLIAVAVVILIATWINGISPLLFNKETQQQQQQFQRNLTFIHWAQHAKPYFNQLKLLPPDLLQTHKNRDWSQTLRSTLQGSVLGESLTMMTQSNAQLSLTFNHAPFDALITQLHGWQLAGMQIQQFNSTTTHDRGYCNVTMLLSLPKGSSHAT